MTTDTLQAAKEGVEYLRRMRSMMVAIAGVVQEPYRRYWEFSQAELDRPGAIADTLESLVAELERVKGENEELKKLEAAVLELGERRRHIEKRF